MTTFSFSLSALTSILILLCTLIAADQTILHDDIVLPICSFLNYQFPGRVAFPGSNAYHSQIATYWASNQGELYSSCRITPWDIADLQGIMYFISLANVAFAVKSGGHSVVANTSNIEEGTVIDLVLLNHINVNLENKYVDVGMGARWIDVYEKLQGQPFGVAGARAGSVGVGGYLLGGGLSVYQGAIGWACDSATLLEVVLANGTLLEVSQGQHPHLYKALKGGATNFGIVSRARIRLIPSLPTIDIKMLQYDLAQLNSLLNAVVRYNSYAAKDPLATASLSIGTQLGGPARISISVVLTHPICINNSLVLQPFFSIPHNIGTQQRMSQYDLALLYDQMNPGGYRQVRTTSTVLNNAHTLEPMRKAMDALVEYFSSLNDTDVQVGFLIQPLTLPHLRASATAGGNILGLEKETSPLLLLSAEVRHSNSENDDVVQAQVLSHMDSIERHAVVHKGLHAFRYLNYASAQQDVFGHIRKDKELWSWLLAVKQAYDPRNIFGRQMKHPFKIDV